MAGPKHVLYSEVFIVPRMPHTSKKYSLDDLLEQDPLSHDLAPHTSRPEHSHAPLPPGGVSRHKERKRGMEQEEKGMGIRKGNSLFAIAKGGWQVPPLRTHKSKGQVWVLLIVVNGLIFLMLFARLVSIFPPGEQGVLILCQTGTASACSIYPAGSHRKKHSLLGMRVQSWCCSMPMLTQK